MRNNALGLFVIFLCAFVPMARMAVPLEQHMAYLPLVTGGHDVEVIGCDGEPQDWAWLIEHFGAVSVEHGPGPQLVSVSCDLSGIAALIISVEHADGTPAQDEIVIRYWPGAPELPDELKGWYDQGVYGPTNETGSIGFGLGHGDYYFPPAGGASSVWVHPGGDVIHGLGMLAGTNHYHLNLRFRVS